MLLLPLLKQGTLDGIVPWLEALKAEDRLALIARDHLCIIDGDGLEFNNRRTALAWTPACQAIRFNERID